MIKKVLYFAICVVVIFSSFQLNGQNSTNSLTLGNPSNFKTSFVYDSKTNTYIKRDLIGDINISGPLYYNFLDFQKLAEKGLIQNYWKELSKSRNVNQVQSLGIPKLFIPGKSFDRIFGGNSVDIRPQGSAELIFGLKINRIDNPALPEEQRKQSLLIFKKRYR